MNFKKVIHLVLRALLLSPMLLSAGEQLLNLPKPEDGLRYKDYSDFAQKWPERFGEGDICLWGDDKFSALSITIDDNNVPDISFWQEMSQEYGWKFTWFLIIHPNVWDVYNNTEGINIGYFGPVSKYKPLYEQGHEIEMHGACQYMNQLTPEEYAIQVQLGIEHIESAIGNKVTTFAYPCGKVDPGDDSRGYAKELSKFMIAARGTRGGATPVQSVDYLETNSLGAIGMHGPANESQSLQRISDNSRPLKYSSYRGWCVLLYHGLKGDEKKDMVREAFAWIHEHENQFWIQPFSHVARYAQERESGQLAIEKVSDREIRFTLTDSMDDKIFNVPVSVKICVNDWKNAAAQQNGKSVNTRIVSHNDINYVLVDAVPDQGEVVILRNT